MFVVLLVLGGIAWALVQRAKPQTILLPDGSQLTLVKVTHGTNHVCRYENRLQDWLQPILPQKLRTKYPPHEVTFTSGSSDTVVVWLRYEGEGRMGDPLRRRGLLFAVADENGLESGLFRTANVTRDLPFQNKVHASGTPVSGPSFTRPTIQIGGWELREFPRRGRRFAIWVYQQEFTEKVLRIGAFTVRNPRPGNSLTWTAETLPATRRTNQLEISLTKLETGLTGQETGHGPAGEGAKSFSRATFKLKENGAPTENWSLCGISSSNAAGEFRPGGSYSSRWQRGEHKVDFEGGLWLEEPAWKINVDFARTGDFPSDELWSIKGVTVPLTGWLMENRIVTNIFNEELEFVGVSGPKTYLPEGYTSLQPHATILVRTAHPMHGVRIALVEVRDDQGRKLATKGSSARTSMGGRGNTPKEMLHGFAVEIPEDAKSLDITFAVTRVRSVEFLAKPVMFDSKSEVQESKSE